MRATVLIATAMNWPFAAQLAGAFTAAGAQVEALAPARSMLSRSRHPVRRHAYSALAPIDSVRRALAEARPHLVIPCDDMMAELTARAHGAAVPGRLEFLERAKAAGAPSLESIDINHDTGLEAAIARYGFPLVLKSDNSWGGDGVLIAQNPHEAGAALSRLARNSRARSLVRFLRGRGGHFLSRALYPVSASLSAQRHVAGAPATSSIACWQGKLLAAHHFDVQLSTTPTSPASVLHRTGCPQMAQGAQAVAAAFNLSGLFGLDYLRDTAGRVHLLEMNARATPTAHLALDQDLVAALLKGAGLASRSRPAVTDRTDIALFPREWLRDPASSFLQSAFHDVPWDDPEVVKACVRQAPKALRAQAAEAFGGALTSESPVFSA
jgi:hypothetical protein